MLAVGLLNSARLPGMRLAPDHGLRYRPSFTRRGLEHLLVTWV
ncbi:MAG TPA: hypothetical protein VFZ66_18030 [Herpetosiphonaceae bacterium]